MLATSLDVITQCAQVGRALSVKTKKKKNKNKNKKNKKKKTSKQNM